MIFFIIDVILFFLAIGTPFLYLRILNFLSKKFSSAAALEARAVSFEPVISVIIPVFNEANVIERRISNIFDSKYPRDKLEIIVVDSGSTDGTYDKVLNRFGEQIVVLREKNRLGKAHAINYALKRATGAIVILTDGPTLYDRNTISEIVRAFQDNAVGAASVTYKIPNIKDSAVTNTEVLLWEYKDKIRILESKIYSTSYLSGEACAFRREIVTNVPEDTLADDSNIALQVIDKGFRVVVSKESFFTEKAPSREDEYFHIKIRRALGGIQEIVRYRKLLFKKRYGYFGYLIFPFRFVIEIFLPCIFLTGLIFILPAVFDIISLIGLGYTILLISVAIVGLVGSFRKCLAYFRTQFILLGALFLLIRNKKEVKWRQSITSRQV